MTPKQRETTIEKIRKLLALAAPDSGATKAEREQAQRRVADLMTKHQIAMLDVDEAERGPITDDRERIEGEANYWRGDLAGRIIRAMGGDYYLTPGSGRGKRTYHVIGRPDDVEFARLLTAHVAPWLTIECEAALAKAIAAGERGTCSRCEGAGYTRRLKGGGYSDTEHECPTCGGSGQVPLHAGVFRRSFYYAAIGKIAGRLHAQRQKTAKAAGKSTDLVVSGKAAIERFYEQNGIKLSSSSASSIGHAAGHASGRDAGSRADLTPSNKVRGGVKALNR